ncbi:helix-turn-helix domain-containing protein [Kribbella sp. NPDC051952]|uniref:helix-turn-helix domain-containing protein n=1 Tax=Kribbella sp. NPDC051952 TaxID=3154851 RepID=UPI00341F3648
MDTPAETNDDEWISAAEAARILGVGRRTVFRMLDRGELHRDKHYRMLRRSAVEAVRDGGEIVSLSEAARILARPLHHVRVLVANGELSSVPNPKWPVFRQDVERYAGGHPAPEDRTPPDRIGQLGTAGAGSVLNVSIDQVRRLARTGLVPADQDAKGRYWFRPDHLEMYQRSRAAEETVEHFGPLPPPGRGPKCQRHGRA